MRCDECKTEPLTPGHYCECCGRKLSLQERRALESTVAPAVAAAPNTVEPSSPKADGDRLVGVHFQNAAAPVGVSPAVTAPAPGPGFLDPILEAHFAGQAPVDAAPSTAAVAVVAAPALAAAAVATPAAAPRVLAANDWVEPAARVAPAIAVELFTDTAPVDVPSSHGDHDAAFPRCEVCGGHAEDGDLCANCRATFHCLLEAPASRAIGASAVDVEVAAVAVAADEPSSPAPATQLAATSTAVVVAPVVADVAPESAPAPEHVHVAPAPPAAPAVAAAAPPAPAIQIKVRPPVAPSLATQPAPESVEAAPSRRQVPPAASTPKPAPSRVAPPSAPAAQPTSGGRKVAGILAVAVALAAIGFPLSKMWLGHQDAPAIVQEQAAPSVAPASEAAPAPLPAVDRNSLPPNEPAASAPAEAGHYDVARAPATLPGPSKVQPAAPSLTKSAAAARPSAAQKPSAKTVRQPVAPPRPAAVVPASSPAVVVPAPEVAPPPPVAAPEPKPEAPAAPIGPFFELRDVNEVPRVLTRVDPQVPDDLGGQQLNEVVIVRVLVTQAGHPMMVNLLRRSKAGASLDEAIVAAVKKWTFVPARRKGEAVSCWYHVGVPVRNSER